MPGKRAFQSPYGFREISHTADWALHVWAPDVKVLFREAARGMYALMAVRINDEPRLDYEIVLAGEDLESLLVAFLSELLYYFEQEKIGFDSLAVEIQPAALHVKASGGKIVGEIQKEIKAVTYHNLQIIQTPEGLEVTIVFDV
jgi:SHS2 domain-containing protein